MESLMGMRGISVITAATLAAELGDISRFSSPRQAMAYAGLVPSEHPSGGKERRGAATKTGNTHVRRVIAEAAWHYRHIPRVGVGLKKRRENLAPEHDT
jgi:transposase